MKKTLLVLAFCALLFPSVSSAAGITYQQASSIIVLLEAFGVNSSTIATVWADIQPADTPLSPPTVATTQDTSPQYQPEFGGVAPVQSIVATSTAIAICDSTPIVQNGVAIEPNAIVGNHLQSANQSITNLALPANGMLSFYMSVSPSCVGNWNIWLDTQNSSSYDNIYGVPSYDAENVAATSPQPASLERLISYNPISTGIHTLTFYAGNGVATSSIAETVIVQ